MRLEEARPDQVVQNRRNSSYYRFVRPEGQRIRIRPLELSPNGLLIEKTADTIVDADLEVDPVAIWSAELFVEVAENVAILLRQQAEAQLLQKTEELVILEAEMLTIDPKERGSHANRVKACRWRVGVLTQGLQERTQAISSTSRQDTVVPHFDVGDILQLPSGQPARLQSYLDNGAEILTKVAGCVTTTAVPTEILRPWTSRNLATI